MSGFAPELHAKAARLIRVLHEAHRREVAQLGHCRTCGDPAPEQDEAPDDDRGLEASTAAQAEKARSRER